MTVKEQDEKVVRTVCMTNCADACGILVHIKDGVVTKVEPADFPEPEFRYACRRALCLPKLLYQPNRLQHPMKRVGERGEGKWQRISWDEALDTIASKLTELGGKYGPECVGYFLGGFGLPNGARFIGERWASASGATWVTEYGAMVAGQFSADSLTFGKFWGVPYLEGFKDPHLIVSWGKNTLETYIWKYRRFTRPAREKGVKWIVVNPLFTPTAAKADQWIPIRPGTDTALILGMINVIISEGLHDQPFLTEHSVGPFLVRNDNGLFLRERHISSGETTSKYIMWDAKTNKPRTYDTPGLEPALMGSFTVDGIECKTAFQLLAELAQQYTLERTSEITEIDPDIIRTFALEYATLKPVKTERGIGLQRTFHGDIAFRAMATLAAVTGNISFEPPDLGPLEGLDWVPFISPGERMHRMMTGLQFYNNHLTGEPYPIRALWISGVNPMNSHPNTNNMKEIFSKLEFIVVTELTMSSTAEYADILLPGCTLFESTNIAMPYQVTWNGDHPYIQMQPKLIEPLYESKSDLEIFSALAPRMGLGEFFQKTAEEYIEDLLNSGHPSMEGITLEKLKEGPIRPSKPSDNPPGTQPGAAGGIYQDELSKGGADFQTRSERFEFYSELLKEYGEELPFYIEPMESPRQPLAQKYPLSLLHRHSKTRFHSHFTEVEWLRELDPEPVLQINPVDAEKRGIQEGDMVTAFNDRGRVKLKARIHPGIRPGVVTVGEGWQARHFAEGCYQELTASTENPALESVTESQGQMNDILVEVKKAEEG